MSETPESFLRAQGLEPLTWPAVLARIEENLTILESETFQRLHRAFAAYPSSYTARTFYDFAAQLSTASCDVLSLLACFRFDRLVNIAAALSLQDFSGRRVLDFGAGGGYLAAYLRDVQGAEVSVTDLSPATLVRLEARGFTTLPDGGGGPFDGIVCADSLGEINADEDDWLATPENLDSESFPRELEARYGFSEKLAALRPLLAQTKNGTNAGAILIFEPVAYSHFWQGTARALKTAGWHAEILGPAPVWGLRLTAT